MEPGWHREAITPAVEETIKGLAGENLVQGFYLAGGTALALHLGHRRSADLDLFSAEAFAEEILLGRLKHLSGFSLIAKSSQTLHVHIRSTKVSFLGYPYPMLFPFAYFSELAVADPRDVACMEISAIASRGTKRDFVDLYVNATRYGLGELLDLFQKKFAEVRYNRIHALKSLTYFKDAEKDPMPDLLIPLSWEEIKSFFTAEVPRIVNR